MSPITSIENSDAHDIGHILSHALTLDVDYSLTDKLAVRVAVPFIAARYYGPTPHQLPMDDGTYHSTFQDFTTDVRYNLTKRRVVLTPFFRVVIPSNSYTYFAHSAAGRDQREYSPWHKRGTPARPIDSQGLHTGSVFVRICRTRSGHCPESQQRRIPTRLLPDSATLASSHRAMDVHAQRP